MQRTDVTMTKALDKIKEKIMNVEIGGRSVGTGNPCYVVAEIGINHNGDLSIAKKLIDVAVASGCSAVKFQKRTIDVVYSAAELERPRDSPFGTTNGELKRALEFGEPQYAEIAAHCKKAGITWFASPWDEASVDFLERFNVPCHKVASASLTDDHLLRHLRKTKKPVILSTGMSTLAQIDHAVEVLGRHDLIVLHATSTYPASYEELNLKVIPVLGQRYNVPVGYSGHETGIASSVASVALGATMVERHLTLDRAMWGSDQAASLEPNGMQRLVRDIRLVETAFGDGKKRLLDREIPIMEKLRRVGL
jgi:N-acetylneuraminate synthase